MHWQVKADYHPQQLGLPAQQQYRQAEMEIKAHAQLIWDKTQVIPQEAYAG
tara:strand:+ start:92 stop:244 length:153 start_codon:yes stop_codon:yes gene_type:complete